MKVLILNGSPKANGNTMVAVNEMVKVFDEEGVETEIVLSQQSKLFLFREGADERTHAGDAALFLRPVGRRHADGDLLSPLVQDAGELPPLGGAAEKKDLHAPYPRGVTILPFTAFVWDEPMNTVVNMSADAEGSSPSGSRRRLCPSRAMFCTRAQRVPAGRTERRSSEARRRESFRWREAGL